jgi:hypothetical protein
LLLTSIMLLGATFCRAGAQGLSYDVPIFEWKEKALSDARKIYRREAHIREVLYCVTSWSESAPQGGIRRIVINAVRAAGTGGTRNIADLEDACRDEAGRPLPSIHTHSEGNCQFSPSDLATFAARRAPFEGVQCGDRHVIWTSSWQIVALGLGAEQLQDARSGFTPP